jgi:DNA polymerase (family X)
MNNLEIALCFERISNLLEIKGENIYIVLAYRRAAESLRSLAEEAGTLRTQKRLNEIQGVGKALAAKIEELLDTGGLVYLKELESEIPPTLLQLLEVPEVGPKKAALFWKQGHITDLEDLEVTARTGNLRKLPGMGEKSESRILAGIEAYHRRSNRMLLSHARSLAEPWLAWLRAQPGVKMAEAAGSLRRWKNTVGDIDLVAGASNGAQIMEAFIQRAEVGRIISQGENKSSIEAAAGGKIQLWIQPPERYGTLLQFVTGSKEHNVRLRELAQKRGWSLSEQVLTDASGRQVFCAGEEEVYQRLGLPWIAPELREDRGELQAALEGKLPDLIETTDLRTDLHTHSTWSDGLGTIREMAQTAVRNGLKVLAITDHTAGVAVANGLSLERLLGQRQEIEIVRQEMGRDLLLLQGAEVEIRADGTLDHPDEVLAQLDIVVASLHFSLTQPRSEITERLLGVIRNPNVDIIAHPTGRLLPNREGADLDWEVILPAAQAAGIALEINSNPNRLDLDEIRARQAAQLGIPLAIDSDAHSPAQLAQVIYGVSDARRAWVEPQQILSTWSTDRLQAWLADRNSSGK